MATSIEVQKQSVKVFLAEGRKHKFVIPEYQRPYNWSDEEVQTLFDDLKEFTSNALLEDKESSYFLGAIVSYNNEDGEQEIIDGQQRITSLFLLLRAIYSKLSSMIEAKQVTHLKSEIEPSLWEQNKITGDVYYDKTLISSKVMDEEGNKVFTDILVSGRVNEGSKDNYSMNYILLSKLIEDYARDEPISFYEFISNVLEKTILLPITADTQDTALTIFSTLNDRGLALSDADIFKAKMYNHLSADEKPGFIEKWQQLDSDATNADESIQKLFYYYMFYLRALENDRSTTTPGIRKFFARNKFEQLYKSGVLSNLDTILNLWLVVNNRITIEEPWAQNIEIRQALDSLSSYPNEFWKYPVVIFYLKHHSTNDFEILFLKFLKRLLAVLLARYIVTPTINAVKGAILNLNAEIIKSSTPKFEFDNISVDDLKDKIKMPHSKTVRVILKILAYTRQEDLLPEKWEIEHILPQKWQSSYFPNTPDSEVKELVEHIGNKIPFEKKLNIIASNGYFQKKQQSYNESKAQILLDLSKNHRDWGIEDIRERDIRIADELLKSLNEWGLNQIDEPVRQEQPPVPTEEELCIIENLRSRGLIQ